MDKKGLIIILFICIITSVTIITINNNVQNANENDDISYNGWTYNKNEYPRNSYTLDELPVSHTSAYSLKQFFTEADFNHDNKLTGKEISAFDYKIKHSQYTYNGAYGYN